MYAGLGWDHIGRNGVGSRGGSEFKSTVHELFANDNRSAKSSQVPSSNGLNSQISRERSFEIRVWPWCGQVEGPVTEDERSGAVEAPFSPQVLPASFSPPSGMITKVAAPTRISPQATLYSWIMGCPGFQPRGGGDLLPRSPVLKSRLILAVKSRIWRILAQFQDGASGRCGDCDGTRRHLFGYLPRPRTRRRDVYVGTRNSPNEMAESHRMSHRTIIPSLYLNSIAIPGNSKISHYLSTIFHHPFFDSSTLTIYMQLEWPEFPTVVCFYGSIPTPLRHCQQAPPPIRLFGTVFGILTHYRPGGAFLVILTLAYLPHGLEVPNTTPLHMPTQETKRVCRPLHWPVEFEHGARDGGVPTVREDGILADLVFCGTMVVSRQLDSDLPRTAPAGNTILGLYVSCLAGPPRVMDLLDVSQPRTSANGRRTATLPGRDERATPVERHAVCAEFNRLQ
ncbi:hypothetical protein B0H17DRAFT_1133737 [Mycena rosella]|uniref:Uncharacterized protein n=1 Tax=Mycena rosella TaxID=1033263 RepID=A0AAD7DGV6_MYCRO|nr:hypothetical protein B0H17DRAFT_1133737 [Mycena rosella]